MSEASDDEFQDREEEEHLDNTEKEHSEDQEDPEEEEHVDNTEKEHSEDQAMMSDQRDSSDDSDDDDDDDSDGGDRLATNRNRKKEAVNQYLKPSSDLVKNISSAQMLHKAEKMRSGLERLCNRFEIVKSKYGRNGLEGPIWWNKILQQFFMQLPTAKEVKEIAEQLRIDEHYATCMLKDIKEGENWEEFDMETYREEAVIIVSTIRDCIIAFGAICHMWGENLGGEYRGIEVKPSASSEAPLDIGENDWEKAQAAFQTYNLKLKGKSIGGREKEWTSWWEDMEVSLRALALEPHTFRLMKEENGNYEFSNDVIKWKKEDGTPVSDMWHNIDKRGKNRKYAGTVLDAYSYNFKHTARAVQSLYDSAKKRKAAAT